MTTKETQADLAAQIVIMDAIEKGHTNKDGLIQYMKSKTFEAAVKRYMALFNDVNVFTETGKLPN